MPAGLGGGEFQPESAERRSRKILAPGNRGNFGPEIEKARSGVLEGSGPDLCVEPGLWFTRKFPPYCH